MSTTHNIRIGFKNSVEHPAIALTTTASATLPLINIQSYKRNRIFRYAASDGKLIKATFGGMAVYCSRASILRHNLEPAGTWRFRGYSDANWTTQVVDSGALTAIESSTLGSLDWGVDPLGSSAAWDAFYGQRNSVAYFTRTLLQSWTIEFNDSGNSSGYIDTSRAWADDHFETTYNPALGMKYGWKEASEIWDTDGGSPHSDGVVPHRVLQLDFRYLPETDRAMFMDIVRYCGMRKSLLVDVYAGDSVAELQRDFFGEFLISQMPDLSTVQYGRDDVSLQLREV